MSVFVEYPRVIYGPGGENMVIDRAEQRPDGWVDSPDAVADDASAARAAAEQADAEAKAAGKALRAGYRDFLDRHNVDYAKNLSTDKLGDLVTQLEAHLAAQEPGKASDDDGE